MADSDTTGNIVESRFKAFVSYSHADKAAAQKLHRKLETYRLPKHLRQPESSTTDEKPVDGRIGPIFRDREDLPAAEDLSESVKKALTVSEALIVLCSPDAQKSPWVAREIELFRELHPDRPVLAAILRGEPEEAFPEPLRQGGEPLAADLRKEGDGARLGFLKVVAGIAGVPLDALINRDAQRRVRRVTAITVAAVAAMVVMALMTTFALQARNEAQHQRAEAEGLVEYMLTDLAEDLEGSAGLAVLAKVNRRALAYYEGQGDLTALPPDSLERRARAIGRLGSDAEARNELSLARRNYSERLRITGELLQERPRNSERMFDHALSLNKLAVLDQKTGANDQARAGFEESWQILTQVNAASSSNREKKRAVTSVAGNLCAMDVIEETVSEQTLKYCQLATLIGRALSSQFGRASRDPYNLVFNLMWQGDVLDQLGDSSGASATRAASLRLSEDLVEANPENRKLISQRMELLGYLAQYQSREDNVRMLREAISIARELIALDPEKTIWQSSLVSYVERLGEME
ncbi:toll/interleukin-1 receptor domain-containing protein [Pontixanthobacter sp. CEM42]|uniref:toll/interleukin-1 receptor domain-containing protein n=1 Tax=Pontixanthobacter sp. CEM42 TaxID=2792077 RepID=UPI001ADF6F77|nr:toll/interleukin-1 receptor domain-containing protein [Pontixanthobacter sp. CEM42]